MEGTLCVCVCVCDNSLAQVLDVPLYTRERERWGGVIEKFYQNGVVVNLSY